MARMLALTATLIIALVSVAGCSPRTAKHHVAVGVPIDHYGALPCRLVKTEPAGVVQSEVFEQRLIGGNPKGIDTTTVRLTASGEARAEVDCADEAKHIVTFGNPTKIDIEFEGFGDGKNVSVGEKMSVRLRAFDAKGRRLQLDNVDSASIKWSFEGPWANEDRSNHMSIFPGQPDRQLASLTTPGTLKVTAEWRGMNAVGEVTAK